MAFTTKENELINTAILRFKLEHKLIEFKKTKANIRIAIDAAHNNFAIISTVPQHTCMYSILRKCDVEIETPQEKVERETKEAKVKKKEKKKKLKEDLEKRHKEELERDIKNMGLEDEEEEIPKEPKPERKDITTAELITNIPTTLEELANPEEKKIEIKDDAPADLDYGNLTNNTVVQLKGLADYLNIEYLSNILKDELIKRIKVVLK